MDQEINALLKVLNGLGGGAIFIFAFMYFVYPRIAKSSGNGNGASAAAYTGKQLNEMQKSCNDNIREIRLTVNEIYKSQNDLSRRFLSVETAINEDMRRRGDL